MGGEETERIVLELDDEEYWVVRQGLIELRRRVRDERAVYAITRVMTRLAPHEFDQYQRWRMRAWQASPRSSLLSRLRGHP